MTASILDLRPTRNTSSELSTEQKRTIRFFAAAHMTAAEIASRARAEAEQVREYCKSIYLNVK